MATFGDVGKDINDQFTKDIAKDQTVELNSTFNKQVSLALKGKIKGKNVDATLAPVFKIPDFNLEIKPEISTPDDKGKTYKVEVIGNDVFTKGLKLDLASFNGKKGEFYLGAAYKNSKFGGVTGRLTFPEGKDKFFSPSLYLETPEFKGFGIGGTGKVVLGEAATLESWKVLGSYKNSTSSANFGFESKYEEKKEEVVEDDKKKKKEEKEPKEDGENADEKKKPVFVNNLYIVGGFLRKFESNRLFALNGSLNTATNDAKVELLYRKNYEDGTFTKIRGDLDGNVGITRQFKTSGFSSAILGTTVNIWSAEGNVGFHFASDL